MRCGATFAVLILAWAAVITSEGHAQSGAAANQPVDCLSGAVYAVPARGAVVEVPLVALPSQVGPDVHALYIGERHGIKGHPRAAACLMSHLAGRVHTLVLEQIRQDQQSIVDTQFTSHPESAGQLGAALTWWKSGWPAWRVYEPLLAMAWIGRMAIRGGDVPTGMNTPSEVELAEQFATRTGSRFERAVTSWSAAMRQAHCNLIEDARARSLAVTQVHRDLSMAGVMQAALRPDGIAMFYSGRAHVRRDRSVPSLVGGDVARSQLSIALIEDSEPRLRRAKAESLRGQFDLVWFVGEAPTNLDSCERLAGLTGRAPTQK